MTDDDYDALSQKQLASIKRDMRISLEDAAVRATYKVMAELETEQNQGEEHMIFNQGKLAGGLVDELLEVIHKYDETLYMVTVIGCLELVKQQLINDAAEENDD